MELETYRSLSNAIWRSNSKRTVRIRSLWQACDREFKISNKRQKTKICRKIKLYRRHRWMSIYATMRIHCNIWMWRSSVRGHNRLHQTFRLWSERRIKTIKMLQLFHSLRVKIKRKVIPHFIDDFFSIKYLKLMSIRKWQY